MARSDDQRTGRGRNWRPDLTALVAIAFAAVALVACGGSGSSSGGVKGASEVSGQPVSSPGTNPFMPPVGTDKNGITPPAGAASSSGGPATYNASLPGLYGGTRNIRSCDAEKMVAFLDQNPSKAAAWAQTLGIQTSQIHDYVSGLTDVILRTDTRVTNHGFVDGHATSLQSVLQSGTAVLVDKYGAPVVKCYCGNPLTAPELLSAPTYTGPLWTNFSATSITIIQQSTTVINVFKLYDPTTGKFFPRYPGLGGHDGPYSGSKPPTPNPGTTSTPAPSAPPSGGEHPSVSLSPSPVTQGGTVTLSVTGFAPNATLTINVQRPDGPDPPRSMTTQGDGSGSYTFNQAAGATPVGTYTVTVTNDATHASASASVQVLPASGGSQSAPGGQSPPSNTSSTPPNTSGGGSTSSPSGQSPVNPSSGQTNTTP